MDAVMSRMPKTPCEALEIVLGLIRYLQQEEHVKIALALAGQVLEKEGVSDLDARKMLAIKLMEMCFQMEDRLEQALTSQELYKKNLFIWDWIFLKHLISTGLQGKELAEQILIQLQENCFYYREDKNSLRLLRNWFKGDSFCSPVFFTLGEALWLDLVKSAWIRKKKMFQPCQKEYGFLRSNLFWLQGRP